MIDIIHFPQLYIIHNYFFVLIGCNYYRVNESKSILIKFIKYFHVIRSLLMLLFVHLRQWKIMIKIIRGRREKKSIYLDVESLFLSLCMKMESFYLVSFALVWVTFNIDLPFDHIFGIVNDQKFFLWPILVVIC